MLNPPIWRHGCYGSADDGVSVRCRRWYRYRKRAEQSGAQRQDESYCAAAGRRCSSTTTTTSSRCQNTKETNASSTSQSSWATPVWKVLLRTCEGPLRRPKFLLVLLGDLRTRRQTAAGRRWRIRWRRRRCVTITSLSLSSAMRYRLPVRPLARSPAANSVPLACAARPAPVTALASQSLCHAIPIHRYSTHSSVLSIVRRWPATGQRGLYPCSAAVGVIEDFAVGAKKLGAVQSNSSMTGFPYFSRPANSYEAYNLLCFWWGAENAGVENEGAITHGKLLEEKTIRYQ